MKRIKDGNRRPTIRVVKKDGTITEDKKEIVEEKRKYYQELYGKRTEKEDLVLKEESMRKVIKKAMKDNKNNDKELNRRFETKEVEKAIDETKRKKASGPDEITNEMLKEGKDLIKTQITEIFNKIKEEKEEIPETWTMGDIIISIYKGKGRMDELINQRGLSLTSAILKCMEKILAERIEPIIKKNSTSLQGGGKRGESPEEYLYILQTIIDINKKEKKQTKLIVTDVEKAFDQAWRVGVMHNLMERGINGQILNLIWQINNNMKARIKEDDIYSDEFEVEESIRQGSCLSAIIYAQHIAKVVEDLEEKDFGRKVGKCKIPAIAWQDDVTLIPEGEEEEDQMIKVFEKGTRENRINLSEKKTKVIIIGKKEGAQTRMKNKIIEEVKEIKVLGYIFSKDGKSMKHIEEKGKEAINMMANMGLSLKNKNMDRIYMRSLIIVYKKCFLPKLLYGLAGIPMNKKEIEGLENTNRKVIRNMLNLPSSTPKIALYNEFGFLTIELMLYKRKLNMWKRLNSTERNKTIKECKREQINKQLPWFLELVRIAAYLKINIQDVNKLSKYKWKKEINRKCREKMKEITMEEINSLKRYKNNIKDEIKPEIAKKYMCLSQKKAKIWCRMRLDLIDPTPRSPYHPKNIWKCRFCEEGQQSTEHYVVHCKGIKINWENIDRGKIYEVIQTLEGNSEELKVISYTLEQIYKELTKERQV